MKAESSLLSRKGPCIAQKFLWIVVLALTFSTGTSMEVKWTPNPDDDGPLPLSQAQRDQLLQLEQAIVSSPDPQATLKQVAETNGMDPQDLVNMLQRNRQDMGGAGAPSRLVKAWPQAVMKIVSSLGLLLSQTARKNPRAFTLAASLLLLLIHVLVAAPRTGLVLSSGSSLLLSKGHTTMWSPPPKYIARYMESNRFGQKDVSLPKKMKSLTWEDLPMSLKDGVETEKLNRKSTLVQAVTAQRIIHVDLFLDEDHEEEENQGEGEDKVDHRAEVLDIMYDAAAEVLSSRRLTEFVDPPEKLRLQSSQEERQQSAILVVQKLGVWGRYGLQPLQVTNCLEGDAVASLTYSTLKGGHFDGQIDIRVEQTKDTLIVQVRLGVPKGGRKLNKKMVSTVTDTLAQSITRSVTTQTKQTLARKLQGKRYRVSSERQLAERRHIRFENERKQEEMARDRRRKWQRQNPDAGHYRPSGDRMRSPNNC